MNEIQLIEIEKIELKYLKKFYHFLKAVEDEMLDGFKTTNDNVNGIMPQYISKAEFQNVTEADYINTTIGTYSYYTAQKQINNN